MGSFFNILFFKRTTLFFIEIGNQKFFNVSHGFHSQFFAQGSLFGIDGIDTIIHQQSDLDIGKTSNGKAADPELRLIDFGKLLPEPGKEVVVQLIHGLIQDIPVDPFLVVIDNFMKPLQ